MIVSVRGKVGSASYVRCLHMAAAVSAIYIAVDTDNLVCHVLSVGEEGCSAIFGGSLPVELDTIVE